MSPDLPSCVPTKPLVALEGEGARAAILNYNLPSSTTFRVKNYIEVRIPDSYWNTAALEASAGPHSPLTEPPKVQREVGEVLEPSSVSGW